MRRVVSYTLLALCAFVTWQSWINSQQGPETEQLGARIACDVDSNCVLSHERAGQTRTDPFGRRYEFSTSVGPVLVTCRRALIFVGEWKCTAEKGGFTGI